MSTIGANFTFATAGNEDNLYGFTYATLKSNALESADTDGFLITGNVHGELYYNAGSVAAPTYTKITNFGTNTGGVQVRITGIYVNNVKVSGSDPKLYWSPNINDTTVAMDPTGVVAGDGPETSGALSGGATLLGTASNLSGAIGAFTVRAVDNVDGSYGAGFITSAPVVGNDTFSGDEAVASVNLNPVNDAPVITSNGGGATASFNVAENTAGTIATVTSADVDGPGATYSISGGADSGLFSINPATGALSFNPAANYEAPTDAGANNVYNITVMVNDGAASNNTDTQDLTITVTNANETPANTAPANGVADIANLIAFDGVVANGHASVVSVSDPDNAVTATTQNLSVDLLLNGLGAGVDVINVTLSGGAAITGGANGSNHITIQGTQADINATLASLVFTGQTGFGSDNLQITTTDIDAGFGGGASSVSNVGLAAGNPTVQSVGVPAAGSYNNVTNLDFTVVFDQVVNVGGTPQLELNVGGATIYADYFGGSGSNTLTFRYNIGVADGDTDGIDIVALGLNGGTINNPGLAPALLGLNNVGDTTGILIDNTADVGGNAAVVINDGDTYIDNDEQATVSYTVSGVDTDATASVTFTSSGGGAPVVVNGLSDGTTTVDLSGLGDGTITAAIQVTDGSTAANTAAGASDTSTKDTTADAGGDIDVTINDGDGYIDNSEKAAVPYSVSGLDGDATASVTFTSSGGAGSVTVNAIAANGAQAPVDLSSLPDGTITAAISVTDTATNTASNATADTSIKDITADAAPVATVLIDGGDAYINALEDDTTSPFTVTGLDGDVTAAIVTFSDGVNPSVDVDVSAGDGPYTVDLTGLNQGTITATLAISDAAGNSATGVGDTIIKDTTADEAPVLSVVINDGDGFIDNSEKAAVFYTVADKDADATATLTFTSSGGAGTVTVNNAVNGTTTVDLSSLPDGTITAAISVTDTAGNSANGTGDTSTKDTTADAAPAATVLIDGGDAYINAVEDDASSPFTVTGLDGDVATAIVTFSDGVNPGVDVDVSAGDGPYTVDLTGLNQGTITATLAISDGAGNSATGVGDTVIKDTIAPTITAPANITLTDTALKDGDTATLTVTFSEEVVGFVAADDVTAPNGSLGAGFTSDDNITFTGTFTPNAATTDATNTIDVDKTGVTDLAGNPGAGPAASSNNYTVDTVHPTITSFDSSTAGGTYGIGAVINVTAHTSEDIKAGTSMDVTLDTGDVVTLNYATATTLTGSYTVSEGDSSTDLNVGSFTAGTVADLADAAGNAMTSTALPGGQNLADNEALVVDGVRPYVVSVNLLGANADNQFKIGDTTVITVVFSEAVTGFDAADMTIDNLTPGGAFTSGDNITWTATYTATNGVDDDVNVATVNLGDWVDAAGNSGATGHGENSANYTVDTVRPTVTITVSDTVLNASETTTVTFDFSEDVQGFTAGDVTVENGSIGAVTQSLADSTIYTATLTPQLAPGVEDNANIMTLNTAWTDMADATGNAPLASTDSNSYSVDTIVPAPSYLAAVYDATADTLTITGSNIGTLRSFAEVYGADIDTQLDFSKLHWDVDGNGSNDFTANGHVQNAYAQDDNTLQIEFVSAWADANIEADANFGSMGSAFWDKLVIENGFSRDTSGNVAAADGATLSILGPLNQAGMPMVFGTNFSDADDLENETLGTAGEASATFDASVDTVHVTTGVDAADLDIYGSAIVGGGSASVSLQLANGSNDVTLTGWNASALGIRDDSILSFDDGSVLRTNATSSKATLSGGSGDDLLVAGSGGDRLLGNAGADKLIGGAGNDQIYGGNGDDVIFGGNGNDYLSGGVGSDDFMFDNAAVTHATISDYEVGVDDIVLAAGLSLSSQADSGADNLLVLSNGSTIRLLGQAAVDVSGDVSNSATFFVGGSDIF